MKRSVYLEPARRLRRMFDGWRSAGAAAGRRAGRLIVSVCRIEAKTPLLTLLTLHYTHSWKDAIRKSKTSADGCRAIDDEAREQGGTGGTGSPAAGV